MFKIIFMIIGTLIGAGFASGREIYLFFLRYGQTGKIGVVLMGISTAIVIYKVLMIVKTYGIDNYNKFLEKINWKHSKINKLINVIVNSFLLISFYIMIAGFGAYMKQTYDIPIYISSTIFVAICYVIFNNKITGIVNANKILVPILILLIIYIGLKNSDYILKESNNILDSTIYDNYIISSILYMSYNSIILIPVLTNLREFVSNKKQIIKISIISGLIIIALSFVIYALLLRGEFYIDDLQMPLLEIVLQFGGIFKYIYGFIIISSIFTSAISTGYSFLKNINQTNYKIVLILMCLTGILISNIGFSNLIQTLYPLFGIFGLIQIYNLAIEKIP